MLHEIIISNELSLTDRQVRTVMALLDEGATVPFISRYRKEMTGSLDEVQITAIRDRALQLRDLDKRREAILKSIGEQGKLTAELEAQIYAIQTMAALEDIYLPYKPKRKTRASVAREKGLQPLAELLLEQTSNDIEGDATKFINEELGVHDITVALAGARDIIAELVAENAEVRAAVRKKFVDDGQFVSRVVPGKEEEAQKYKD
jgi:uncharacterized protein